MDPKPSGRDAIWIKRLLIGLVAATVTVAALKTLWPKPTYSDLAQNVVDGLISGNGSGLERLIPEDEMRAYGWDEGNVRKFFDKFVRPRTAGLRVYRRIQKKIVARGFAGLYAAELTDGRHTFELSEQVDATPDGPKVSLRSLIMFVWVANALHSGQTFHNSLDALTLHALQRDRSELEALGVKGLLSDAETPELRTWDSMESGFKLRLGRQ